MPTRVKPIHDLGPCFLDLNGIKGICKVIDRNFKGAKYSATDQYWEVYDEPSNRFIDFITNRRRLDEFSVSATREILVSHLDGVDLLPPIANITSELKLVFNWQEATLRFKGEEKQDSQTTEEFIEHLLMDIKKYLRPDRGYQVRMSISENMFKRFGLYRYPIYCTIRLYQSPPNPLAENIKANMISNFLWVPITFIGGVIFAITAYFFYTNFGINLPDLIPSIPTPTP